MASKKPPLETAAPASDKKKALETAVAQIERNFGKGSIMRLGENTQTVVDAIPTGSLSLDLALGIGGVPRGRIIEIYGPESSGKTTLALHIVAEAQKRGGEVAYIDAEHAMDPYYARALGVDIDSMLISQPDTGEQGLEICEALVRSGALDVVVVDSDRTDFGFSLPHSSSRNCGLMTKQTAMSCSPSASHEISVCRLGRKKSPAFNSTAWLPTLMWIPPVMT